MAAVPGKPPSLGRQPMAKESNKAFKATVAMVGRVFLSNLDLENYNFADMRSGMQVET